MPATNSQITKALDQLSASDPTLATLITNFAKPDFHRYDDYFNELARNIISQQLSTHAARAICNRFTGLFDDKFPLPEQILATDEISLRGAGLSFQKIKYLRDLSEKVSTHIINFDNIENKSNQQIIDELTAVKGIGEWTAQMFLMFSMARLDILPTGDLGVRNAVARNYGVDPTPDNVRTIAEANNWHPYESVAAWYMWESLDNMPTI